MGDYEIAEGKVIELEFLEKPIKEPRTSTKDRKPKVDQKILISFSIKKEEVDGGKTKVKAAKQDMIGEEQDGDEDN